MVQSGLNRTYERVCVCVFERERERERMSVRYSELLPEEYGLHVGSYTTKYCSVTSRYKY